MALSLLAAPATGGADIKTTVTTYSYNVDGALTAIAVEVDGAPSAKTYLTWDSFTPDADDPSAGMVSAGDGRLIGFGPGPGLAGAVSTFEFDPRDRLQSYTDTLNATTYAYHAAGTMMSSSAAGDDRRFYYDTSRYPQVTNIHQSGQGLWSAYLGRARFLDDGSEEILLRPRKDAACSYDTAAETLESYVYDAFGSSDEDLPSEYDLHDNPFRYGGEYRDPLWGGYYLRARWYHPDLPSFVSRDPEPKLNRYAYGSGNPVMHTDPSGMSSKFYGKTEHFLQHLDTSLNAGVGGHFARIFLAPLLGPLQIAAYPEQFWHAVKTDQAGTDVFLALGILSEVAGGMADSYLAGYGVSLARRFALRTASDLAIGISSSIAAGASHGFNHFNWNNFVDGLELTAGAVLDRGIAGTNVRSGFQLSTDDVLSLVKKDLDKASDGTALVFRQRTPLGRGEAYEAAADTHSPLREAASLGYYHERLIAITKDEILLNDAIDTGIRVTAKGFRTFDAVQKSILGFKGKFEFVGRVDDLSEGASARERFLGNPQQRLVSTNLTEFDDDDLRTLQPKVTLYDSFFNNCQHHAYAVLKDMGLR